MEERHMSPRLYKAATRGAVHYLPSDTEIVSEERKDLLSLMTTEGNNCLHIAARFGHEEFVQRVVGLCPSLVYQQNKKGDNPLHVAARAGHLCVVKLLINRAAANEGVPSEGRFPREDDTTCNRSSTEDEEGKTPSCPIWRTQSQQNNMATSSIKPHRSSTQSESTSDIGTGTTSQWPSLPIWLTRNHDGSTALHEALRNKHEEMALYLLDLDREQVVLVVNAKNESPLYLAAEAGFVGVLVKILNAGGSNNFVGPMGQTALHAAVLSRSTESISVLNMRIPGLTRKQDLYGKTALYYATQADSLEIVCLLLNLDAASAYIWDNEGLSPLLVAASISSPAIRAILDAFPASIEYSDNRGYNALHLAVINYSSLQLLKIPGMMTLVNEPDKEGNTPLHLAVMDHHFRMANALLSTERVDLTAKNNLGQTVLDVCVLEAPVLLYSPQRGLWHTLKKKGAPMGRVRPLTRLRGGGPSYMSTKMADAMVDLERLFNTVSVVAALLATITFAAPFQIPGGYTLSTEGSKSKSKSQSNLGYSFFIQKPALTLFLLLDTTAFLFSTVALLLLLMAAFNRKAFLRTAAHRAVRFVVRAIYAAMFAFISGLFAVTLEVSIWVAIFICIIGSSLCIFHLRMFQLASIESMFVPGLLRSQMEIPDEQMARV